MGERERLEFNMERAKDPAVTTEHYGGPSSHKKPRMGTGREESPADLHGETGEGGKQETCRVRGEEKSGRDRPALHQDGGQGGSCMIQDPGSSILYCHCRYQLSSPECCNK